jgi:hypothetical protein
MEKIVQDWNVPASRFPYDRFDTPDDEQDGKWSVNFSTNPQGEIDRLLMSLDEAEVTFMRRVAAELSTPATLRSYTPMNVRSKSSWRMDGVYQSKRSPHPFYWTGSSR